MQVMKQSSPKTAELVDLQKKHFTLKNHEILDIPDELMFIF